MADLAPTPAWIRRIVRAAAALASGTLLIAGCAGLPRSSAALHAVPAGFVRVAPADPPCGPFPGRELVRQERHLRSAADGGSSTIVITEYRGRISERDVLAAHDVIVRRERLESFGALESLTIDGRPAWSWFMVRPRSRSGQRTECVAVVSYDTSAFVIQLSTAEGRLQDPALQQRIVASFVAPASEPRPGPGFFGFGLVAAMVCALLLVMTLPRGADD